MCLTTGIRNDGGLRYSAHAELIAHSVEDTGAMRPTSISAQGTEPVLSAPLKADRIRCGFDYKPVAQRTSLQSDGKVPFWTAAEFLRLAQLTQEREGVSGPLRCTPACHQATIC